MHGSVPRNAVEQSIAREFPDGSITGCKAEHEDGHDRFEVKLTGKGGDNLEVDVAPDGKILQIEAPIALEKVPAAVMTAFSAKYPGVKPSRAEKQTRTGKSAAYELAFTSGSKNKEVTFAEDGTFLEEGDASPSAELDLEARPGEPRAHDDERGDVARPEAIPVLRDHARARRPPHWLPYCDDVVEVPLGRDAGAAADALEHREVGLVADVDEAPLAVGADPAPGSRLRSALICLMANFCTAEPFCRKWPVRGIITSSQPAGLGRRRSSTRGARATGTLVETTAALVASPKRTAVERSEKSIDARRVLGLHDEHVVGQRPGPSVEEVHVRAEGAARRVQVERGHRRGRARLAMRAASAGMQVSGEQPPAITMPMSEGLMPARSIAMSAARRPVSALE